MRIQVHESVGRIAQSEGFAFDTARFKKKLQKIADELDLSGRVRQIIVIGSEGSGVELVGSPKGNAVVYSFDPYYAQDHEIRHELMHVADRLDPTFKFDIADASLASDDYPRQMKKVSETRMSRWILLNELWNANIDGRLKGRGIPRSVRYQSFAATVRLFTRISEAECRALFDRLWADKIIPYPELRRETARMLSKKH